MGLKFKRVLLKLSGEVFGGSGGYGFDYDAVGRIAQQVKEIHDLGVEVGLVVGAGNIFRGTRNAPPGMDRVAADHMGMLGTVINAICLQEMLERLEVKTRVMTAIEMHELAEPYIKRKATRHLEKGRVVIFAAGTGNPFFTTDTAAALRALEMAADVLIKATKVDGIYDADPVTHPDATRYDVLSHKEVLRLDLKVMDAPAIALCKDNDIPILVVNLESESDLIRAVEGETIGTLVR